MKVFTNTPRYSERWNAVDDNNVFVGFDYGSCCCESFKAAFYRKVPDKDIWVEMQDDEFKADNTYAFDIKFFENSGIPGIHDDQDFDNGGCVKFRAMNAEGEEIFLVLENTHNGYYSHGFEAAINGQKWQEGSI